MTWVQCIGAIEIGLIYSLVGLAVYLSFRVIHFSDLTVDGSLTLGAAISAVCILHGLNPWVSMFLACVGGGIAGCVTAVLNRKFQFQDLLSGILVMTGLYSVNLRIMDKPNLSLFGRNTIFVGESALWMLVGIVGVVFLIINFLLRTDWGLGVRSVGSSERVAQAYGVRPSIAVMSVLIISNGLVALAGSLLAQLQEFVDVSMGMGTIVAGLAAVIIGGQVIRSTRFDVVLWSSLLGAIVFRVVMALALNASDLGLRSSDLNLIMTSLVIVFLLISRVKKLKRKVAV
jgi:putative ABC transport system permease protein